MAPHASAPIAQKSSSRAEFSGCSPDGASHKSYGSLDQ
jgi:hypothetical protein